MAATLYYQQKVSSISAKYLLISFSPLYLTVINAKCNQMFEQLYEMSENFANKMNVYDLCKSSYLLIFKRPICVTDFIKMERSSISVY